ncbi:WD40-repeat-containing domain protein [Boletus coccyginus]|nr:WD40-repeat-containing domain protein [Boletus coccyginus]
MSSTTKVRFDNDGQPYLVIPTRGDEVWWLEYLPDGRRVVTGSRDGTVRVWNLESGEQEGTSMEHNRKMSGLAVTRDGTKIIGGACGGWIKVWDVKSHELVREWIHPDPADYPKIAISPNDRLISVAHRRGVDICSLERSRIIHSIEMRRRHTWFICFSPDGTKFACGTDDDDIRVYDLASGTLILCLLDGDWATNVLWSRDGSRLFSGSQDGTICCWDSDTGKKIGHPWTGHIHYIHSLSLSPDGTILASASWDKTVRFWNATTGEPVGQHLNHGDGVNAVCFSPSGEFVATAGLDRKIYIWRVVEHLRQCQRSNFNANFPPPPDLTPYIFRADDQYVAGGGFGDVYRCWCDHGGSPVEVAVKAFRFTFATDGDTSDKSAKMLRRELGIWRRLDHINVVPFLGIAYGFGMRGAMSLVSLWMPNESLHHFLVKHDHTLFSGHRIGFLLDIANGLHYLHYFPVVHGDLNCHNVLLDADYTARLADFGYASLVGNIPEALTYLQRSTA